MEKTGLKFFRVRNKDGSYQQDVPIEVDASHVIMENGETLDSYIQKKANVEQIENIKRIIQSPLIATKIADMQRTDKIYIYMGQEEKHFKRGYWYYYNGILWEEGGVYSSQLEKFKIKQLEQRINTAFITEKLSGYSIQFFDGANNIPFKSFKIKIISTLDEKTNHFIGYDEIRFLLSTTEGGFYFEIPLPQTIYDGEIDLLTGQVLINKQHIASYAEEPIQKYKWTSNKDSYIAGTLPSLESQVLYDLDEPRTYTIPAKEINTFLGYNFIMPDDKFYFQVEYRADTQLYINKKIFNNDNIIAKKEDSFIASHNYEKGDLIIINNILYKVLNTILKGNKISPQINVETTLISEEIKATRKDKI